MVRACSAINCSNRNFSGNLPAFHKFPLRDKVRLREWLKNMQRKDFTPTNTSYLCSNHFENTSYWKGHRLKLLKDDAVPTIFNFTTSNTKKVRKRRVSKTKDDSSETKYPPAKKATSKFKKKIKHYRTTFSTDLVTKNKILEKPVISDTNTESNSDVDSVLFFDEILIKNASGEIIILNIDSDEETDLIKDKYVKADHNYVWPLQSEEQELTETIAKELSSGVAICKKRPVKLDDASKNIGNTKRLINLNDLIDKIPLNTVDFSIANCNRMSASQIVKNECKISSVELNNTQNLTDLDFETDILKSTAVTDKQLFEAIKEMGKTNAVILIVKEDTGSKVGYEECEVGEILENLNSSIVFEDNISFETNKNGRERPVRIEREMQEKHAALSSKLVCNDNVISKGKLIGSYDDSLKDCDINAVDELEIGEFYNGGLKIGGEIGKSNAEVIKMLQLKNLEESENLISTINKQKDEIDRLKKLLCYERAKTEI